MYRVRFEPSGSFWVVEILRSHLFWTICESPDGVNHTFQTVEHARKWLTALGIDKLYQDRSGSYQVYAPTQTKEPEE